MTSTGLTKGDRVYHPKWREYGTVVRILPTEPGYPDSVGVRFDGVAMTETECAESELDQVPGTDANTEPPEGELFTDR